MQYKCIYFFKKMLLVTFLVGDGCLAWNLEANPTTFEFTVTTPAL
jgi:hypothetical protein